MRASICWPCADGLAHVYGGPEFARAVTVGILASHSQPTMASHTGRKYSGITA